MHSYLLSAAADYMPEALRELRRADRDLRATAEPDPELTVVESALDMGELHAALERVAPLFVRHIAPAQLTVPLTGVKAGDLDRMAEAVDEMEELEGIEAGERFSVQARVLTAPGVARPYSPFAIKEALAPVVAEATGAIEEVREPEIVLTVLALPEVAYIGLSPVAFNRSGWTGGARRFAREAGQLSRSEFKLLEALEWGGIDATNGRALDLGAAPGGWTRVLLDAGAARVTAVDPADLDPTVLRDRRVTPVRDHAQEWLYHAVERGWKFDLVVSDVRMDARDAARLMVEAAPLLEREGHAVVTLKLPPPGTPGLDGAAIAREALEELRSRYRTVRARQLYHNRHEVTAILAL